jgi:hypothetical protein
MSITDPSGGGIISGGVIETYPPGEDISPPVIIIVQGVSMPRISYSNKIIYLPKMPYDYRIEPLTPKTVVTTLTGAIEALRLPRIDIRVKAVFRPSLDLALMYQLENWWQWAQQGNVFEIVFDATKTKQTVTTAVAVAGTSALELSDVTDITVGSYYALRGGPNYQIVCVASVAGYTVNLTGSLNFNFPTGATFRDIYCWNAVIRDERPTTPITPVLDYAAGTQFPNSFQLEFEFFESLV